MKTTLRFLGISILILFSSTTYSQYFIESELVSITPVSALSAFGTLAVYDVEYYAINYNTTGIDGAPVVASGAVAIPVAEDCDSLPMLVYCHGTVLRQLDVPSQAENQESQLVTVFASTGYISVAPDYLGLGINPGRHPYIHAASEATATIDLMRATFEFLETIDTDWNEQSFITGYSQGGHAAMAALKFAQDNDLNEELGIVAGAPCSGPYNLSESQTAVLLSDAPYSNPGYVIYLLMSYDLAYDNLYDELSDVIQSPYAEEVMPYFDGSQNEFDMGDVNALLPNQLSELLVDTTLANFQNNPNHPLRLNLQDNDNFDWTPQVPLRLYYCSGDEQVSPENSIVAASTMVANGATDVQAINALPGANHGFCVLPAISQVLQFFDANANFCQQIDGIADVQVADLIMAPNPASDFVNVTWTHDPNMLYVQNMYGKVVLEKMMYSGTNRIDLSRLHAAPYILSIRDKDRISRAKLIVN